MTGFIFGVTRMILDFVYQAPSCDQKDERPFIVKDFHYMYFALMIFLLTGVVCIVISLLTPAPDPELVCNLIFILALHLQDGRLYSSLSFEAVGREPLWLRDRLKPHILKCVSMKAIQLDIGVTCDHTIVLFGTELANALSSYRVARWAF